jgi:hypothetical protein
MDKEKRENIDLKNQASKHYALKGKELSLAKENLSEEKTTSTTKLIEQIRQDSQSDNWIH